MNDLKTCPWCGGIAQIAHGQRGWKVECEGRFGSCYMNARTHYQPTKYLALNAWNTRAAPKVKPLRWVTPSPTTDGTWQDETGIYDIEEGILFIGHVSTGIRCGSDEKAKARAQADHERRIREALE